MHEPTTRPRKGKHDQYVLVCESVHHTFSSSIHICLLAVIYLSSLDRVEGWVKIEFTITPEGEVTDAAVIEAEPVDVFDEIVLSKVESWQLKPKIVNGIAVKQRATKTLQFKLTN